MSRSWNVPVDGKGMTIQEIPESQCEKCQKCKAQLGENTHRGSKRVRQKMAGYDQDGEAVEGNQRVAKTFYYCSPECLEAHGAVEDAEFGF